MKNSQFLKDSKVAYLGGDDTWYASDVQDYMVPDGPITLSGKLVDILHVATMLSLSIVPEAQNMTKYDGSGIATVTLSPARMDVNIAGGTSSNYTPVDAEVTVSPLFTMDVLVGCAYCEEILETEEITGGSFTVTKGNSSTFRGVLNTVVYFTTPTYESLLPTSTVGLERIEGTTYFRVTGDWGATFSGSQPA